MSPRRYTLSRNFATERSKGNSLLLPDEVLRLRKENIQFRSENQQLRQIFDIATDRFNSMKQQVEQLKRDLATEKDYRKELEKENQRLKKQLNA